MTLVVYEVGPACQIRNVMFVQLFSQMNTDIKQIIDTFSDHVDHHCISPCTFLVLINSAISDSRMMDFHYFET